MKATYRLACVALLSSSGCGLLGGLVDQVELIGVVQRVALKPGVDALDPSGPTAVGEDWRRIEFDFTEPMSESTVSSFRVESNLVLGDGLALDEAHPPAFNVAPIGLIPARSRLVVTLEPMAEGDYEITLKSSPAAPLTGASGSTIIGRFMFRVSVNAKDGIRPFVRRFRPSDNQGATDQIAMNAWLDAGGLVDHGFKVAPHALLRAEFSERMRTPIPIEVTPTVRDFVPTDAGPILTRVAPGIGFRSSIETVSGSSVTVLESGTTEGMELDTQYEFVFPSRPALGSYQPFVRDRSGEPLAVRFAEPFDVKLEMDDIRRLKTAPIRLSVPVHRSYLNAAAFASGSLSLVLGGELADRVSSIDLSVVKQGQVVPLGAAARIVTSESNRTDVPIDRFSSAVTLGLATDADGEYEIVADARDAAGTSLGEDRIVVTKDTVGPSLLAGGTVEILITDFRVPEFCVTTSASDAVRADVVFGGIVLASSTEPSLGRLLIGTIGRRELRFCFDPFQIPATATAGTNVWTVRLTDEAGNVSETITTLNLRPVLVSVSPVGARAGDVVEVTGYGIDAVSAAGSVVLQGASVPLSHAFDAVDSGPSIFVSASGTPALTDLDRVQLVVPDFAASGALALTVDGIVSTTALVTICDVLRPMPFATDFDAAGVSELDPANVGLSAQPFVGDLGLTGVVTDMAPVPGGPDVGQAGLPVVFAAALNGGLEARIFRPEIADWQPETISSGIVTRGFAAVQGPRGDAEVAYVERLPQLGNTHLVWIASRTIQGGVNVWTSRLVTAHAGPSAGSTTLPVEPSVAAAYSADGRAAVAYVAPLENPLVSGLWVAIETAPKSSVFARIVVDETPDSTGPVSAAFANDGTLWVAHNRLQNITPIGSVFAKQFEKVGINIAKVNVLPGGSLAVNGVSSPAFGLWPSIAIDPITDQPGISYQRTEWFATVRQGPPEFALWDGQEWQHESVTEVPFREIPLDEEQAADPLQVRNLNLRVTRSVLRFDPTGIARVSFSPLNGGLYVATRTSPGVWAEDLIEVSPGPGPTLAMALDGAGVPRLAYHDARSPGLRFYRDEDNRALRRESPPPVCAGDRYVGTTFGTGIGVFLALYDDFPFTLDALQELNDPARQLEFLVTVLQKPTQNDANRTRLFSDRDRRSFEVALAFGEGELDRLEAVYFSPEIVDLTEIHSYIRLSPAISLDPGADAELEIRAAENGINSDVLCCDCPPDDPACCPNPLQCRASAMVCTNAPVAVENCFGEGVPGLLPPELFQLGDDIRNLEGRLPLLAHSQTLDDDQIKGTIESLRADLRGVELSALPSERDSSGRLIVDLPVQSFSATVMVRKTAGIDVTEVCGGTFRIRASDGEQKLRLRVEGPPVFVSRENSARFGLPRMSKPQGRAVIAASDIDLDFGEGEACTELIRTHKDRIQREVARALGEPKDELKENLERLAQSLQPALVTPMLEQILVPFSPFSRRGNRGVVLFVDESGRLRSIHEKDETLGSTLGRLR